MKQHFLIFGVLLVYFLNFSNKQELSGLYVSKSPDRGEKIRVMYSKGYYNFLYTDSNEVVLKLNNDKSFSYEQLLCKAGNTIRSGKWKYDKGILYLDFSNPDTTDLEFTVNSDEIYRISDINIKGNPELRKSLCFLKKQ